MDVENRMEIVKEVGEEIITEEDLKKLLETKQHPVAYQGFEPSGKPHIAQGIMVANNISRFQKAGIKYKLWVADWFAYLNNKLEGDIEKIRNTGKYLLEVWKAAGVDMEKVDVLWTSNAVNDGNYWEIVMRVSKEATVKRVLRCGQIMGRKEGELQQTSQIFYPCMQVADFFYIGADIGQHGLDQRKAQMLAREIGERIGYWKPVCVHHHMLMGLAKPSRQDLSSMDQKIELKMSKSKPHTAIFMTDSGKEVEEKINHAYCPAKETEDNPLIDYAKHLIFSNFREVTITRPEKFGGPVTYASLRELADDYRKGELHALDLKKGVADYTNLLLEPVRKHFEKSKPKKLKEEVESYTITR